MLSFVCVDTSLSNMCRRLLPNQAQRDAVQRRAQEIEAERERDFYNDRTGSILHQTSATSGYYTSQYGNLPSNSGSSSSRDAYGSPRDNGLISRYNEPSRYETPSLAPTDPTVSRSSVYDESSRPAYQMAPIEGGVWKAVTDLAKHPTEGWMSLWKGNQRSKLRRQMDRLWSNQAMELTKRIKSISSSIL
jgi:hypothetical protein